MMAGGFPLSQLVVILLPMVERTVVDKTGLIWNFDFELKWTPEPRLQGPPPGAVPDPDRPSIFTALQEQLGLKLAPAKGSVDVLVIDRVERPTPD